MSPMQTSTLLRILAFALVPVAAAIVGAVIAAVRTPGSTARSYIQHLAAGVVFSVVAVELLPEVVRERMPLQVLIGFIIGVVVMFGIKHLTEGARPKEGEEESSAGMMWAIGVDLALDGILIGVGFAKGGEAGLMLTVALAVELLSLSLAITAALLKQGISKVKAVLTTAALSSLIIVGAMAGALILSALPAAGVELVLSFGLAALLYLVTEELLVEAHEEQETPLATAMFFVGFLGFLMLGMG